jgi:hypothetical protein
MASLQLGAQTEQTEHAAHTGVSRDAESSAVGVGPAVVGSSAVGTAASRRDDFFTGAVFAATVALPWLSNAELFALSTCSRKLLCLRYDLDRWAVVLTADTYESFRIRREAVPVCFDLPTFDLAVYLGPRLSVSMHDRQYGHKTQNDNGFWLALYGLFWESPGVNADALAGVHSVDLSCTGLRDVRALGGVSILRLHRCNEVRDVGALGRVTTLDLSWCEGVSDVSAL